MNDEREAYECVDESEDRELESGLKINCRYNCVKYIVGSSGLSACLIGALGVVRTGINSPGRS